MDIKELKTPLNIEDIDFRVQSINKGGYATILAYKDARADMRRLDEVCEAGGWQRDHKELKGNIYCGVGIKINDEWIWKWDCGSESAAEKEKGESSDSFKRACFNWGIGIELYDFPIIQVKLNENEITKTGDRIKPTWEFKLKEWNWFIQYSGEVINYLGAKDQNGELRFNYGKYIKK